MKQAILKLARSGGAFAFCRFLNRQKLLILMYHRFGDSDNCFSITPHAFEEQLQFLKTRYNVLSLSSIAQRLAAGTALPPCTAAITIDDGYRDAYEIAFPLLRRHNLPAAIFVVTDFVDHRAWLWTDKLRFTALRTAVKALDFQIGSNKISLRLNGRLSRLEAADRVNSLLKQLPDDEKEESLLRIASAFGVTIPDHPPAEFEALNWEELKEMMASKIEVGSHTVSHPILTAVGADRLRRELRVSKDRLESTLQCEISLFCYPNGSASPEIVKEAVLAGYRCAVTTIPGLNYPSNDLMALRRIAAESDLDHFAQSTSGFEEVKNNLRRVGQKR